MSETYETIVTSRSSSSSSSSKNSLTHSIDSSSSSYDEPFFLYESEYDEKSYTTTTSDDDDHNNPSSSYKTLNDGKYEILSRLGKGGGGVVYRCYDTTEKEYVAIKVARKSYERDELRDEIDCINRIQSYDTSQSFRFTEIKKVFQDTDEENDGRILCTVMPEYGSTLWQYIEKNRFRGMKMSTIRNLAYQILQTIQFMHKHRWVHNDIKSDNILFETPSRKGHVVLIDFGKATRSYKMCDFLSGTVPYLSPENILEDARLLSCDSLHPFNNYMKKVPYDPRARDIFALGLVFYEMYTGSSIFHDCFVVGGPNQHVMVDVDDSHLTWFDRIGYLCRFVEDVPPYILPFIETIGGKYNNSRTLLEQRQFGFEPPPLSQVVREEHEEFYLLLRGMLDLNPIKRMTATECLGHSFLRRKTF